MFNLSKQLTVWILAINLGLLIGFYYFAIEVYPGEKTYPNHIHTTIYIDSSFDDFERAAIMEAALEWTSTTNHIIDYDIVQLPTMEPIDFDHAIIIYNTTEDHPIVLALDATNNHTTLGFFDKKSVITYIGLVNARIKNDDYKPVVMHELGHSLGLDHNEEFDTLMYPSRNAIVNQQFIKVSADHITLKDGIQFCLLYHCNPMKLTYQ